MTRFLPADVVSISTGLGAQVWGAAGPTDVHLHSGHPLLVDDRIWIAEVEPGIWMSMGPIQSEVDYFPDPEEGDSVGDEPPPLVLTAGTVVTPEGNKVDLNPPNAIRCPYSGSIPEDPANNKVLVFVNPDNTCTEIPADPGFPVGPVGSTQTPTGRVFVSLNISGEFNNPTSKANIGQALRANTSTLRDNADNPLSNPTFQWLVDSSPIPGATQRTLLLTADHVGEITVQATEIKGSITYDAPISSPAVTVTAFPANTPSTCLLYTSPSPRDS